MKQLVQKLFNQVGLDLHRPSYNPSQRGHELVRPFTTYAPWSLDENFRETLNVVRSKTLVDHYRLWELWSLVEQVKDVPGALIEIGVWRGGSGALIAHHAKTLAIVDPVYLCDTFEGVPKAGQQDSLYVGGEHDDTTLDFLSELGLENCKVLKGIFFEETHELIESEKFRLVHIDVDVYQSAKD